MFIVGLCGGIGSGKTTVSEVFSREFKVPVYLSDKRAKQVIEQNKQIREEIVREFGKQAFENEKYNSQFISKIVFSDAKKLTILNNITHPRIRQDFFLWANSQKSPYVIVESAILFESGFYEFCDAIVGVVAPENQRIERVVKRDGSSRESVEKRMKNQKSDEFIAKSSDFIIENADSSNILENIYAIHREILKTIEENQQLTKS